MHYICARDLSKYIGKQVSMVGWLVTGKTVEEKRLTLMIR
jgi:hypothetical protein